jgi:RNA polymerase sigma-70 factor (ECF subfamily)
MPLPTYFKKSVLFPTTRWTRIAEVQAGSPEEAGRALEQLCRSYWYPVYAFLRRSGRSQDDAADLTQNFFHGIVMGDALQKARKEGGRLRSYLLGILMRQLSDSDRYDAAQKRGGGTPVVSLEELGAEERYASEPRDDRHPEASFSRTWATELLAHARQELRLNFEKSGRGPVFDALEPYLLWDQPQPPQAGLAKLMGSSESAARVLIFRTRHKFRELLQKEIARTVLTPSETADEMIWLMGVLAEA